MKIKRKVNYLPASRTDAAKALRKPVPERICIGAREGNECNQKFMPKSLWNYLCIRCNEYAMKNSED